MKLGKIVKSNLIFLLIILAFNYLFYLQQTRQGELLGNLEAFERSFVFGSQISFIVILLLLSFVLSLFSLPGAGFTFSLGGFIFGMPYLLIAGLILFLASLVSFRLVSRARQKSTFFKKVFDSKTFSHLPKTDLFLFLFRMNPAVPFIFLVSLYKKSLSIRTIGVLFVSSYFHALIYVFIGNILKTKTSSFNELVFYSLLLTVVTLIPLSLMILFKQSLD